MSGQEIEREWDEDTLTEDELQDLDAPTESDTVRYSGQDFDINGLIRRYDNGDIIVPLFGLIDSSVDTAGFQRGFVWSRRQMDRFVESILLGYPIPGIFLERQRDKRLLVLDGQQRLQTLAAYQAGMHRDRVFRLSNVSSQFDGLMYKDLLPEQRRLFDDTFIQATIVDAGQTDASLNAIYQIFERLNSGGTQLTPHQIRVALFSGPLIEQLEVLNNNSSWRDLYSPKPNPRIRDQELILRILALFINRAEYSRPLKKFLNNFASEHRQASKLDLIKAVRLFEKSAKLLAAGPGGESLRRKSTVVNAAQAEAVFVALMDEVNKRELTSAQVVSALERLKSSTKFDDMMERNTSDEESVRTRLAEAQAAFEKV